MVSRYGSGRRVALPLLLWRRGLGRGGPFAHFDEGIEELRFWNHQWRSNREGVLWEISHALQRRTGCLGACPDLTDTG